MSTEQIERELLNVGLHQQSTERMIEHYQKMRTHLLRGQYVEAGSHVGNFCENVANILLEQMGEGAQDSVKVGKFVDDCLCGKIGTSEPDAVRLTIPRVLRGAYELRNSRDSVHVNLEVPVNHADTQAAVRQCSWILSELLRVYGSNGDMDDIANLIESLSHPLSSYIDEHDGHRLIQHTDLNTTEEVLLHLMNTTGEVDVDDLVRWIPDASLQSVTGSLGSLKQKRQVRYDTDEHTAILTKLGREKAAEVEEKYFGD
jgi:hypothetical protein